MSDSNGLTFWDWFAGEHPTLKGIGTGLFFITILVLIGYYLGWISVALFIGSMIIFYLIMKSILMTSESNLLLVLDPKNPTQVGVYLLGSEKWKTLVLDKGDLVPFTTSAGTHAIFATSYDGKNISASWVHEIDRTQFLTKSAIYDTAIKVAEDCYSQLTLIRNIPYLMGVQTAGLAINVYEKEKLNDISSLDPKENVEDVLEILRKIKDPIETLKEDLQ